MFGVIGCGKMGMSIINGVIKNVIKKNDLLLYDSYAETNEELLKKGFNVAKSSLEVYQKCDFILIAVKPQNFPDLLNQLKMEKLEKVILSIAAGISTSNIKKVLPHAKVVRIMPNTPALIGKGCSVITYDKKITNKEKNFIEKVFLSIGSLDEINESLMDDITPINGSFPAFAYYFMQAFIESSAKRKISIDLARKLVVESMIGSAEMIKQSEKPIDELIKDVCSPGGTTIEGIKVFEKRKLKKIVDEAAIKCAKRAKVLGGNK